MRDGVRMRWDGWVWNILALYSPSHCAECAYVIYAEPLDDKPVLPQKNLLIGPQRILPRQVIYISMYLFMEYLQYNSLRTPPPGGLLAFLSSRRHLLLPDGLYHTLILIHTQTQRRLRHLLRLIGRNFVWQDYSRETLARYLLHLARTRYLTHDANSL